jgi:hypothetical protein
MKISYKKGIGFFVSALAIYILERIFGWTESHLTDISKFIVTTSRTILDYTSISLAIIGVIIIILSFKHAHKVVKMELREASTNKESSNMIVEIKDKYWYPPEKEFNSVFYTVYIKTLLKNIGNHDTAIHTVSIAFDYKGKSHEYITMIQNEIKMYSGDSKNQAFTFNINEDDIQIDNNLRDVKFTLEHTYDKIELIIKEIPRLSKRHF